VLGLLRRSVDDFNQTVVMVTHDPRVASYADRVVVLADGQIVHDGRVSSADEVLSLMQSV
jgi:putative ABC transport system ATP-binding protein